jgi:hypothetical protein
MPHTRPLPCRQGASFYAVCSFAGKRKELPDEPVKQKLRTGRGCHPNYYPNPAGYSPPYIGCLPAFFL